MATGKALDGKPYAGNPHVRFDEGEVAPAATPRRGSLLYKKLMFMLAAVVTAAAVQAASVSWTCTNVKDSSGSKISGVAYFINAATLSQSDFKSLNGADAFNTALSGMYSWTPGTAGKYSSTAPVENATLGLSDAHEGYSVYLAVFDTATITDSSNYYLTGVQSLDTLSGTYTASVAFGNQSTPSQAAGAWGSVSDVPEPTSGLLMLIGLAGLALRRKRA